jgi:hypothetical protein
VSLGKGGMRGEGKGALRRPTEGAGGSSRLGWVSVPLSRAARLRRAAAVLAEHDAALAEALATMAIASGVSLDQAMGWPQGWQQHDQRRLRDQAIRELAGTMSGSVHQQARAIEAVLRRGTSPEAKAILAANANKPLGFESIRKLLG